MGEGRRLEVYTDGRCPLCQWSRRQVEPLDVNRRLEWLDYHDPDALGRAAPHTPKQLADEMHVRRPDGTWARGYWAWVEVVGVLPRWGWLKGPLAGWPFKSFGPFLYRQLAKRRYQIFGVPPPCDDAGVCSVHAKK